MLFTVTRAAGQQIRRATAPETEGMSLRVAATKRDDGGLDYGMGFDDKKADDVEITAEGISVVISASHVPLLKGATMDYVEIEPGQYRFIFINPNDPACAPASEG
jgi:iron-sulfur cluster assembly protein